MGRRMQPRNENLFTLFRNDAGSNVVVSAAMLMESAAAPDEHWAELAKRVHDTEHADDDTTNGRDGAAVRGAGPAPRSAQRAGAMFLHLR